MAAGSELQRLADASEADSALRYVRRQRLAHVVLEAMQRADAMSRLDANLRNSERRPAA